MILAAITLVVLAVGYYLYVDYQFKQSSTQPTSTSDKVLANEIKNLPASETIDNSALYQKYTQRYSEVRDQVIASDPRKWDSDMVEKAYFLLMFSEKTKSYNLVNIVLADFDRAKAAGVNIDDKASGFDENYRNKIRAEAEAVVGAFDNKNGLKGKGQ